MPRLTNHTYLLQCRQLRAHWRDPSKNAFFLLTPNEQWSLYAYFLPNENLSDHDLLIHREDISSFDPSLPQRAGRAFSKLWVVSRRIEAYREQMKSRPKTHPKKNTEKKVVLFSEVHPVLDPDQIARILLRYEPRKK